eukprot:985647-Pyramimonas_sp.AAC.1
MCIHKHIRLNPNINKHNIVTLEIQAHQTSGDTGHRTPGTGHRTPDTGHWPPATSHQPPHTRHRTPPEGPRPY